MRRMFWGIVAVCNGLLAVANWMVFVEESMTVAALVAVLCLVGMLSAILFAKEA